MVGTGHREKIGGRKNGEKTDRFGTEPIYGIPDDCGSKQAHQLHGTKEQAKEREREILFARGFGELDFTELGEKFGMEPKQAEMAYYYIIRKLRKGMGVRKDEF